MTYEDPRTGRERNLGQDSGSAWSWIMGLVAVAVIALGAWYYYGNTQTAEMSKPSSTAADTSSSIPATQQSSGPGVQGAPGGTNGPAMKPSDNASSTGASSGTSGSGKIDPATQPSQDATGVKGAEGGTSGPSQKTPSNP